MKTEKRWIVAFVAISIIALAGLFWENDNHLIEKEFNPTETISASDTSWVLTSSCLVMLMIPGLSFFYGGMVGKKNVISTMLQSFISLGVVGLVWVFIGFSLAFGTPHTITINGNEYGLFGSFTDYFFFNNVWIHPHKVLANTIPFVLFAVFQMKFAVIAPAIITGSFAERVRFISYLVFMVLFTIFIYTPLCHMVWHPSGLLSSFFGIRDFAGGTVVHMSAGFAALAGAWVLGQRDNRASIPTNIPFVLLGTGMLWFGWFGFNAGSALGANGTAAMAFATTTVASASAMITWIFFDRINGRKVSTLGACVGAVVGLVVITPAAGFVSVPISVFFGFVGAIISNLVLNSKWMKKIDDTLDVFACHGVGGIVGMILTGIFAEGQNASLLHGGWGVFGHHIVALVIVSAFTFFGSLLLYKITNAMIPLRVSKASENMGLDLSQHNERLF